MDSVVNVLCELPIDKEDIRNSLYLLKESVKDAANSYGISYEDASRVICNECSYPGMNLSLLARIVDNLSIRCHTTSRPNTFVRCLRKSIIKSTFDYAYVLNMKENKR